MLFIAISQGLVTNSEEVRSVYARWLTPGVTCVTIGTWFTLVQLIRQDKVLKGVVVYFLNLLTMGILGLLFTSIEIKNITNFIETEEYPANKLSRLQKKDSLYRGYKAAFIIAIIGMVTILIGGAAIIVIASLIAGIQKLREEKIISGILIILFGGLTLGILPLVVGIKGSREYNYSEDSIYV